MVANTIFNIYYNFLAFSWTYLQIVLDRGLYYTRKSSHSFFLYSLPIVQQNCKKVGCRLKIKKTITNSSCLQLSNTILNIYYNFIAFSWTYLQIVSDRELYYIRKSSQFSFFKLTHYSLILECILSILFSMHFLKVLTRRIYLSIKSFFG